MKKTLFFTLLALVSTSVLAEDHCPDKDAIVHQKLREESRIRQSDVIEKFLTLGRDSRKRRKLDDEGGVSLEEYLDRCKKNNKCAHFKIFQEGEKTIEFKLDPEEI